MTFCRIILIIVLTAFATSNASPPETSTITGTVMTHNNEPLAMANVFLKESVEGTMTDEKGNFSFNTSATGQLTLVCSYIGYLTYHKVLEVKASSTLQVKIVLQATAIETRPVMITASAFTAANEEGVTLTAMDVVRIPGAAADLFWAIKTFPGLQQVDEGAGLFVRGGDVSETTILLDGAVINHPYKYESPTGGFFGTFNPFLLKGTYFSSGGFSAQYGNALSGALAMQSLDLPTRRQIGVGIGLAAESAYLSLPLVEDKFGISFSGNKSNTRMMFELNQAKKDFSHYPSSFDLNVNAYYKMNNHSHCKFFIFREDDQVGVEIDDPDYRSVHYKGNSSNQFYNLKYSNLMEKNFLVQANLAYSNFDQDLQLSVMDLEMQDRLYQMRISGESEIITGLKVRTGLDFFQYQTVIEGNVMRNELNLNPDAATDPVDTDYHSNRAVQFVEVEAITPIGLKIAPGLRGEYESVSREYIFDPRISALYPTGLHSNITAAWGIYHQYPEPRYHDPYVGNPELSSMQSVHYIFGYAFQQEYKIFRLEGYYKDYRDLLLEDEKVNYTNNGWGYAMGMDVFAKNSYGPVSGWIAYSWLKARRKWQDLPLLASPYFDITHNLTCVLNLELPKNFSLGASFRYATGKPYTPAPAQYHTARVPDYQKLDISLSYLYSFFDGNFTVFYCSIANALNRINIFDYRYSSDYQRRDPVESSFGRSVYFGVSFNM